MSYFFTSESVGEGHPDKIADQISDALLDEFLRHDPNSKVACETMVTTGLAIVSGEVRTHAYVDVQQTVRDVIRKIGYTKGEYKFEAESCGVLSAIHEQSSDIHQGVERGTKENQGAGDQGMMFGYACCDTEQYMPLPIMLAHSLLTELSIIRHEGKLMPYLRPDAKSQVTVQYSDKGIAERIEAIVVSTQHDDNTSQERIYNDVCNILIPRVIAKQPTNIQQLFVMPGQNDTASKALKLHVNPTGSFVIGGPHGDTGLTGRKIIVDTYGGRGAHGGGAFSGKDSSKVDRSAAYAARHIAKNMVAAGVADEVLVQVAYAIGEAEPVGFYINTYGTSHVDMSDGEIAQKIGKIFDMRPFAIVERFGLQNPIYLPTATYGHFGKEPYSKEVSFFNNGKEEKRRVQFFGWEKLDYVQQLKSEFNI
ncbi:MAG: methionine adenosyltransferase [Bacteroidales bacterium]|nr:methionine adenosyltransferase [Bacteroidales bacterium]